MVNEASCVVLPQPSAFTMDGMQLSDTGSITASITVLSVTPVRAGKLFAFASVEIDLDGVRLEIRGIRAMHVPPAATRIEPPMFRDASGVSRAAVILPEELRAAIGDLVLDALIEPASR